MGRNLINYNIPSNINKNISNVYGHLISDGHIGKLLDGCRLSYFNKEVKLIEDFNLRFIELFNKKGHIYKNKDNFYSWTISSKVLWKYFKFFDINQILNSKNKKIKVLFLQACFDDEGSISKRGIISICQKDFNYINNIKNLLEDLNIKETRLYSIYNKKYNKRYYYLRISKKENYVFFKQINFLHPNKNNILKNNLNYKEVNKK